MRSSSWSRLSTVTVVAGLGFAVASLASACLDYAGEDWGVEEGCTSSTTTSTSTSTSTSTGTGSGSGSAAVPASTADCGAPVVVGSGSGTGSL